MPVEVEPSQLNSLPLPLLISSASIATVVVAYIWHNLKVPVLIAKRHTCSQSSLLEDEFTCSAEGGPEDSWRVKSLWIYPIKSCRGVELTESRVVSTGLEYDRQYMLAEWRPNGRTGVNELVFITQRQYPLMARIRTAIKPAAKGVSAGGRGGTALSVSFPVQTTWPLNLLSGGTEIMASFDLPLDIDEKSLSEFPLVPAKFWRETVIAHDMTRLLPQGVAQFIQAKYPVILLRMPPARPRNVYRNAPRKDELGYQPVVGFADSYPLNLINIASVRDLNSKITDSIPNLSAMRFRSNIILSGPPAFAEDDWKKISIGGHIYHVACRTLRCKLPNVDQDSGERHPHEPDRTIRTYRRIDKGNDKYACMGMQVVPAIEAGIIRVGEPIKVLETGEHSFVDR